MKILKYGISQTVAQEADAKVRAIPGRVMKVLDIAKAENIPPHQAADRIVREKIAAARKN